MVYEAKVWRSGQAGGTPLTAAALNDLENAMAQASADSTSAVDTANTAVSTAEAAKATADGIDGKATRALNESASAVDTAGSVETAWGEWRTAADQALDTATATAQAAKATADGIDGKASEALAKASAAVDTANTAEATAKAAKATADGVDGKASEALEKAARVDGYEARISDLEQRPTGGLTEEDRQEIDAAIKTVADQAEENRQQFRHYLPNSTFVPFEIQQHELTNKVASVTASVDSISNQLPNLASGRELDELAARVGTIENTNSTQSNQINTTNKQVETLTAASAQTAQQAQALDGRVTALEQGGTTQHISAPVVKSFAPFSSCQMTVNLFKFDKTIIMSFTMYFSQNNFYGDRGSLALTSAYIPYSSQPGLKFKTSNGGTVTVDVTKGSSTVSFQVDQYKDGGMCSGTVVWEAR